MPRRITTEAVDNGWTTVRIKRSLLKRAGELGDLLSGAGAAYVVERAVEDLLKMADTPPGQRRVPMLVRLADAARDDLAPLLAEDAPAPSKGSSSQRGALRVGQG